VFSQKTTSLNRSNSVASSTLQEGSAARVLMSIIGERIGDSSQSSSSSQSLMVSPLTSSPRTPFGRRSNRFNKGELVEAVKEVVKFTNQQMLGQMNELLEKKQELKHENHLLQQKIAELQEFQLQAQEDRLQRLVESRHLD
jgi:hypothetical protein